MGSEGDSVPARTRGERFRVIAPWLVCLGIFGSGAVVFDGLERAIAVGAFSASWVAALLAVSQVRGAVVSMRRWMGNREDRKSTRLNSSHTVISYAVFCLKKKNGRRLNIATTDGRASRPLDAQRDHQR